MSDIAAGGASFALNTAISISQVSSYSLYCVLMPHAGKQPTAEDAIAEVNRVLAKAAPAIAAAQAAQAAKQQAAATPTASVPTPPASYAPAPLQAATNWGAAPPQATSAIPSSAQIFGSPSTSNGRNHKRALRYTSWSEEQGLPSSNPDRAGYAGGEIVAGSGDDGYDPYEDIVDNTATGSTLPQQAIGAVPQVDTSLTRYSSLHRFDPIALSAGGRKLQEQPTAAHSLIHTSLLYASQEQQQEEKEEDKQQQPQTGGSLHSRRLLQGGGGAGAGSGGGSGGGGTFGLRKNAERVWTWNGLFSTITVRKGGSGGSGGAGAGGGGGGGGAGGGAGGAASGAGGARSGAAGAGGAGGTPTVRCVSCLACRPMRSEQAMAHQHPGTRVYSMSGLASCLASCFQVNAALRCHHEHTHAQ